MRTSALASFVAYFVLAACSASGPSGRAEPKGGSANVGAGGGGPLGAGGTVGLGFGGAAVSLPNSGAAGLSGCNDKQIESKPVTPTVLLLVDTSSSMFDDRPHLWDALFNALMDPTNGVVAPLQDKVRFGFSSYKGISKGGLAENDPACATITKVPFALHNFDAINTTYTQLGTLPVEKWETPTAFAVKLAEQDLAAYNPDPPGPKYILLVTDGDPDTCQVPGQQCGQDLSLKAVQDAHAAGIGTLVIGVGDIVGSGCDMNATRCGPQHLQDLANAGQGLPVNPPPDSYKYQQCVTMAGGLTAAYAASAADAGKATFYAAKTPDELRTALSGLLNGVVSCTFDMNATVTGDPGSGTVLLGSQKLTYNDPNGWMLESNKVQVTLTGTACDTIKAGMANLAISFPCDQVVPR